MGKIFDGIDAQLERWIAAQQLFFVASAPLADSGHVNVSPKGPAGTLRVLDPCTVAYLDLVGSGAETIAHVRENGRIVIMLCAFQGPPRIVPSGGGVDRAATRCAARRLGLPVRQSALSGRRRHGRGGHGDGPRAALEFTE